MMPSADEALNRVGAARALLARTAEGRRRVGIVGGFRGGGFAIEGAAPGREPHQAVGESRA